MHATASAIPRARLIAILGLLASFGPCATDMYLSAFPEMRADLHTDAGGVAATLSVFLFGLAAGQLVYGPVSDRFGRRRPMLAGTALFTAASLGCMVSTGVTGFIAMRALQALGGCCGIILGRAVVRDLYDEREMARAFSLFSMISLGAPIVAPTLGVAVILVGGWRAVFGFTALLGLATMAAIWFGLRESLPPERRTAHLSPRSIGRVFARLIGHRRFLLAALTAGSAAGVLFAFITGSSLTFITHYGFGKTGYTAVFSAVVIAMIVGAQANRLALKRWPAEVVLRRALAVNALLGLVLLASASGPAWPLAAVLWCAVATLGFILPNSAAAAITASAGDAGSASSLLGTIQFGCGFLSSSAVAALQDGSAWPMAGAICGCAVAGWVAWWVAERTPRPGLV